MGKRKLDGHEKALERSKTTVPSHVRSPSQTRPLAVPNRKRSLSIDNALRAPAPPLLSRSNRNRAPGATPVTATPSTREGGRAAVQVAIQPPTLRRSASSDPVARPQVLRAPEYRRPAVADPPAAPKVSRSWYTPAKPVSVSPPVLGRRSAPQANGIPERRTTEGPSRSGTGHERPRVQAQSQQSARNRREETRRDDRLQDAGNNNRKETHQAEDSPRRQGRVGSEVRQERPSGESRGSSGRHEPQDAHAHRRAQSGSVEQPAPILGESAQRRHRQQGSTGGHPQEIVRQDGHSNRTNSAESLASMRSHESSTRNQARVHADRHRRPGQTHPGQASPPKPSREEGQDAATAMARGERERGRQTLPQKLENVQPSRIFSGMTMSEGPKTIDGSSKRSEFRNMAKEDTPRARHPSQDSLESDSSSSVYSQPSVAQPARRDHVPSGPQANRVVNLKSERHGRSEDSMENACAERQQPSEETRRGRPTRRPSLVGRRSFDQPQNSAPAIRRDKPHPPLPAGSPERASEASEVSNQQRVLQASSGQVPTRTESGTTANTLGGKLSLNSLASSGTLVSESSIAHLGSNGSTSKISKSQPVGGIASMHDASGPRQPRRRFFLYRAVSEEGRAAEVNEVLRAQRENKGDPRGAAASRAHTRGASDSDHKPAVSGSSMKDLPQVPLPKLKYLCYEPPSAELGVAQPPLVPPKLQGPLIDARPPRRRRS